MDQKNNIQSIIIKCFNITKKNEFLFNQNIKDLLNVDFISKEEIKKEMNKIIEKIDKILEKNELNKNKSNENDNNEKENKKENNKEIEDEDEEYTF